MKTKSKAGHDVVGIKKTALKAFVYRCTTCLYAFFFFFFALCNCLAERFVERLATLCLTVGPGRTSNNVAP